MKVFQMKNVKVLKTIQLMIYIMNNSTAYYKILMVKFSVGGNSDL